ncbi:MAG: hypothetical protein ABIR24_03725 [Verrucomicrobiota bacterium]
MKNLKQSIQLLGIQIVLLTAVAHPAAYSAIAKANAAPKPNSAAATNAAPAEAEPIVQKSVFDDNLKKGKDPFFPKSARRAEKLPAVDTKVTAPLIQLSLKGISGPANRRFALINNQPLAAGETAYVRIATGQVKVHCLEIRENSVIISVEGDTEQKELRLREGL